MTVYKYLTTSFIVCMLFLASCAKVDNEPKMLIEFEIEADVSKDQKQKAINQLQNRLESIGATNITVTNDDGRKVTFTFQGKIRPKKIKKNFIVAGKLEFFEIVADKYLINAFLGAMYTSNSEDENLLTEKTPVRKDLAEFTDIVRVATNNTRDGIIGYIDAKDRERLEASAIFKKPFYLGNSKAKAKFLLGKSYNENELSVYVVYTTPRGNAVLDGSYIVSAFSKEGYREGIYVVSLKMNDEGAKIWEQLTEKVYNTRGAIAVTMDDFVYSAPTVTNGKISGGMTEISGGFTKETAEEMAVVIGSGTIPKVKITKMDVIGRTTNEK